MCQSQAWGLSDPQRELVLYSHLMHFIVVNSSSSPPYNPWKTFIVLNSHFPKLIILVLFLFIHTLPGLSGFSGTHARPTDLHA